MNDTQVIAHLRGRVKPYVGIMEQGSFSNAVTRHEAGLMKPKTLEKFLAKFGYVKTVNGWNFVPEKQIA